MISISLAASQIIMFLSLLTFWASRKDKAACKALPPRCVSEMRRVVEGFDWIKIT